MSSPDNTQEASIKVGAWCFYPDLNRLKGPSSVIHLEPKAALVLRLLIERAGRVVTRQELLEVAWEGVVVGDDALTQVIIKLRKALGDSSRNSRYIQTIPKRGYCLLAEVETVAVATALPAQHNQPDRLRGIFPFGVVAIVLLAVLLLLYGIFAPSVEDPAVGELAAKETTLSVMRFVAVNESERERHFARGMWADLITDLASLPGLAVITPSLKSTLPSSRYQVQGDIQLLEGRIGVHVRLLETASQRQLWSQRYERALDDIFAVQRSISRNVVEQLALQVSAADLQRLASRYTPSLAAYEDFLRGQADLLLREQEANASARRWYRQAIEHDANFARAYAGLALSYAADYRNHWAQDGQMALAQAQEMAQTGAQIDPDIAEVFWVLGYVATQNRQHTQALNYLDKALQVDHSYADAYALKGGVKTYQGSPRQSVEQLRRALRLNENAGYLYYLLLGRAYYFLGSEEQAAINLLESLARNPTNLETHIYLLALAVKQGDIDTAVWELEEIRMIAPQFNSDVWLDTYPMVAKGQRSQLAQALHQIERLAADNAMY